MKSIINLLRKVLGHGQQTNQKEPITFVIPGYSKYIYDIEHDTVTKSEVMKINNGDTTRFSGRRIVKRNNKYFFLIPDNDTIPKAITTTKILNLLNINKD